MDGQSRGVELRTVFRLVAGMRLVFRAAPGWNTAAWTLTALQAVLPLATLYFTKLLVDALASGGAPSGHLWLLLGGITGAALADTGARALRGIVVEAQGHAATDYLQDLLHAKAVEVDLEYYESAGYYDRLHLAQQQASYRCLRIVNGIAQLLQQTLSLLAVGGLLLALHPLAGLALLAVAIPGFLVRLGYGRLFYRWLKLLVPAERRAWYVHSLLTGPEHAKEVRLLGLGELLRERYRGLRRQVREQSLKLAVRRALAEFAVQALGALAAFAAAAYVAFRTTGGALTVGDLVLYLGLLQRAQSAVHELLSGLGGLYEDALFFRDLESFLELERRVADPADPVPVPRPTQMGFALEGVSFHYPGSARPVLQGISLSIRPGEVAALVGENGSGKTSLVKLLCRLYDPTEGSITLDGKALRQFRVADLRREISVIFQDYARYHLSARENIRLGNVELDEQDPRVEEAARQADADGVIRALPQGYDTLLGKEFEEGQELSVGQWQKIALARAFLRDAQLIILDEPTSAMDARAEYEVFQRFRALLTGRSAILISHRMSTVRMADRIYVLSEGRIVESGTHDELLQQDGVYSRLFRMQAEAYR